MGLNHALNQLKELFIESIVEKDQEILILKENLQDAQKIIFEDQQNIEKIKILTRQQAIEAEEREDILEQKLIIQKANLEKEYFGRIEAEYQQFYKKEQDLVFRYSDLESKVHNLEHLLQHQTQVSQDLQQKLDNNSKENQRLIAEIHNYKIDLQNLNKEKKDFKDILKERDRNYESLIKESNDNFQRLQKSLIEKEQKLLLSENTALLYLHKLEKKRNKLFHERQISSESNENLKEIKKTLINMENEWNKEKKQLNDEISALSLKKIQRKKYAKITSLQDEIWSETKEGNKYPFSCLFEKVRGPEISKSKFSQIQNIMDDFIINFVENWENVDLLEEIKEIWEKVQIILNKIEKEQKEVKENLIISEKEILDYKKNFLDLLEKFKEKEKKEKERKKIFNLF